MKAFILAVLGLFAINTALIANEPTANTEGAAATTEAAGQPAGDHPGTTTEDPHHKKGTKNKPTTPKPKAGKGKTEEKGS